MYILTGYQYSVLQYIRKHNVVSPLKQGVVSTGVVQSDGGPAQTEGLCFVPGWDDPVGEREANLWGGVAGVSRMALILSSIPPSTTDSSEESC